MLTIVNAANLQIMPDALNANYLVTLTAVLERALDVRQQLAER
ncbi:unnamed protein product [marine sediment metagenome]|uniref:Uncharacterized protein n=1 Tax=marine sediment metagenome TaxID=412755 RepID=X1DLQ1_9ZZZZ